MKYAGCYSAGGNEQLKIALAQQNGAGGTGGTTSPESGAGMLFNPGFKGDDQLGLGADRRRRHP